MKPAEDRGGARRIWSQRRARDGGAAPGRRRRSRRSARRIGVNLLWMVPGVVGGSEDYVVALFRTAMLGTPAAVFVTANVATLCFGALALVEVNDWLPLQAGFVLEWKAQTGQAAAVVFGTWVVLNLIALYASRSAQQLREFASRLQQKVDERTRELTAVNAELATKARALEEKQAELRTVVGAVTHEISLRSVLFPAPLRPISPTTSPAPTCSETSRTAKKSSTCAFGDDCDPPSRRRLILRAPKPKSSDSRVVAGP